MMKQMKNSGAAGANPQARERRKIPDCLFGFLGNSRIPECPGNFRQCLGNFRHVLGHSSGSGGFIASQCVVLRSSVLLKGPCHRILLCIFWKFRRNFRQKVGTRALKF
jgi:hypothetical protein